MAAPLHRCRAPHVQSPGRRPKPYGLGAVSARRSEYPAQPSRVWLGRHCTPLASLLLPGRSVYKISLAPLRPRGRVTGRKGVRWPYARCASAVGSPEPRSAAQARAAPSTMQIPLAARHRRYPSPRYFGPFRTPRRVATLFFASQCYVFAVIFGYGRGVVVIGVGRAGPGRSKSNELLMMSR